MAIAPDSDKARSSCRSIVLHKLGPRRQPGSATPLPGLDQNIVTAPFCQLGSKLGNSGGASTSPGTDSDRFDIPFDCSPIRFNHGADKRPFRDFHVEPVLFSV